MICPRCAHPNPPDVKFCNDCGQMMGSICSSCGTVNLPESKFCSQCGNLLAKIDIPAADDKLLKRFARMSIKVLSPRLMPERENT